ncbi:MAG TPA: outer membrane protein transport protein, partial [Kofleriaceae bacterium]|nr:outer membrane protein transport protein [Kofleriaceae bacterium]
LARVQLLPITEPSFVLLGNDPHRIVVEPVAGVAYGDKHALGVGASLLADARSRQLVFDVGVVGGEKVGAAALDVDLPVRVAPLVGVWLRPSPRVRAGLTWRGELSLDLALDIRANVQVAGVVTGDVLVSLRARNYFTPGRLAGGLAVDVTDRFTLDGDVTWNRWSSYPPPPDLAVLVALDLTPPLVSTERPPADFHDTVDVRVGGEYRGGGRLAPALRGGVAWRPSPVPEQTGLTSYADGDRLELTAGAGVRLGWRPIFLHPIDVDVALQWQHVAGRLTVKDAGIAPGQAFSSGGDVLHAGVTSTVRF